MLKLKETQQLLSEKLLRIERKARLILNKTDPMNFAVYK